MCFSSAWMVYVPAVVCVCRIQEAEVHVSRRWKTFVVICFAASMSFGLPKALIGILNEWALRNYAVVETFIAPRVGAKDTAYCDPAAYFAAKPRATRVYGPGYPMSTGEKRAITVAIVDPAEEAGVIRQLGGEWTTTGQLVRESRSSTEKRLPISTRFGYRLDVLRRSGP